MDQTTREHFGSALASLAHLYEAAEGRGDMEHAERYSAAVQLLLGGWPADGEPAPAPGPAPAEAGGSTWPACEPTLVGIGVVR
jgi:hypothetical protein